MMAVHDVVRIGEVGGIGRGQEDAAERHPAGLPVEVGFEVVLIVGAVHYGEVDGGAGNVDPPHHIGVDGPQGVPIDGEACKVHTLKRSCIGGVEADLLELLVVLLAVPIAVADEGQRACGA